MLKRADGSIKVTSVRCRSALVNLAVYNDRGSEMCIAILLDDDQFGNGNPKRVSQSALAPVVFVFFAVFFALILSRCVAKRVSAIVNS